MDHNSTDKEWQKLQVHIDQTFGRYLRDSPDLSYSERHGAFGVKSLPKTTGTTIKRRTFK
jgi:hypothetical protein